MSGERKPRNRVAPHDELELWLERDLTAEAEADRLFPAFGVEDLVGEVADLLSGPRHPVLVGEPGVGKTAVVHEIARHCRDGRGPEPLEGRRLIQLSLQRRAAGLARAMEMRPAMERLVDALIALGDDIAPFFRDFHHAWELELEPLFQTLAFRFPGPMLLEGRPGSIQAMLETSPELAEHYHVVPVDEPGLERSRRLLAAWAEEFERRNGTRFEPSAVEQALQLSHRFLARGRMPRKALELLGQSASLAQDDEGCRVAGAHVIERFCRSHHVPRRLVDPSVRLDLDDLERELRQQVLGQAEAVRAVVSTLGLIKAGLTDLRRPFASLLFVGPTGVGKTHVAQLLAECLFGGRDRLIRVNMSDFSEPGADHALFGHPGAGLAGALTRRVAGHPFAVLLLDEFEKAHPSVHDRFLQLMDEGCFINGAGDTVACRSMIIIATSNVGAEVYRGHGFGFRDPEDLEARRRELDKRLHEAFRIEFLNRFDQVVHFRPLSRSHVRTIARRELEALEKRPGMSERGLALDVDESVLDWLAAHGYDPDHGARFLRRTMERHVTTPLAQAIVRDEPPAGTRLLMSVRGGRVIARRRREEASVARRAVELPVGTRTERRRLDPGELAREADAVLEAAATRLSELDARRAEHAELVAAMGDSGFWERGPESREALARFRELDVALQVEERLAAPLLRLADAREREPTSQRDAARLADALESASAALRDWEERLAASGGAAAWLVVSVADPLRPDADWLEQVARMELAWCRRLHLQCSVAAIELGEDGPLRAVLDVEGPGAVAYLAPEEGLHRLQAKRRRADSKVAVELLPKGAAPASSWPGQHPTRRREGPLGLALQSRARLDVEARGLSVELCGADPEVLAHALSDLEQRWSRAPESPAVARVYAEGGEGARDPRTNAGCSRLKDVLAGELDVFLEAWRRRGAEEQGG